MISLRRALLACTLLAMGCGDTSPGEPFPRPVVAQLDREVGAMLEQGLSPGAMISVTTPRGTLTRAYGLADTGAAAPMHPDLRFRIGSVTKTFTITVLLMLVDEGRLGLDDPISRYLDDVPRGDAVTLRMMAGMTSGLPNYTENRDFVRALIQDWSYEWQPEQLLGFAYDQSFLFTPGTDLHYSNTNTVLLGLVIERVEGRPIGEVFQDRIFAPLGLESTWWPNDASLAGPHVHGYSALNEQEAVEDATAWSPSEAFAAGQLVSSLADLRAWIAVLARGELLSAQTQAERVAWSPVGGNTAERFYALGIFGIDGWLGHDGDIPGYNTYAMYNPELEASIVVMTNADAPFGDHDPADALIRAVSEILFPGHAIDALTLPPGVQLGGLTLR